MDESRSTSPLLPKERKTREGDEEILEEENKTSSAQAFFNIFNANMGTGVLAMPYVVRLTSYWGVILIIIIAFLGNYTGSSSFTVSEKTPRTRISRSLPTLIWARRFGQSMGVLWFISLTSLSSFPTALCSLSCVVPYCIIHSQIVLCPKACGLPWSPLQCYPAPAYAQ